MSANPAIKYQASFLGEGSNSYVQGDCSAWLQQGLVCQKPAFSSLSSVWYATPAVLAQR